MSASKPAYLVLGMHRSGTSAVTQLLAFAGAKLPAQVMPGDEHNEKGYFEPWKIAIFNDERLRAAGSAWDDPFAYPFRPLPEADEQVWRARALTLFREDYAGVDPPLMKDPRATVLLPFWRAVLGEAGFGIRAVVPVRHPLAVAGSLKRRNGFPDEKSVLLWAAYMLAAEAYTRDLPRAFVDYDALLADWRAELAKIEAAHGAPLPRLTAAAGKRIDAFLSPELRHNAGRGGLEALGWAGEIAGQVLGWFEAAAAGGAPDRAPLEAAAAALARRAQEVGVLVSPAARDLDEARAQLLVARQGLAAERDFRAKLRRELAVEMKRQRKVLETGWRDDVRRLDALVADERRRLTEVAAQVSAELDRALSDD